MDKTRIIFVRHAKAQYGEDDRERPLTESGLENRKIVLDTLKDQKIDCFLSSPYKRSYDTIKPLADHFKKNIITDERFRERKVGTWKDDWLYKRWADFTCAEEGGECLLSVQTRNMEALKEVLIKHENETVVIGTHGTALSTILNYYDKSYGISDFLRIVSLMPYMIELDFEKDRLTDIRELAYVETKEN